MTDERRILLVDDDPNDVELILAAFEEHDLDSRVDVVRDGGEALAYLRREGAFADRPTGNPAVVLLDLKMPRLGGLDFLRDLRRESGFAGVPVVVLTSSKEPRDVEECYRTGVNAYVVKPVAFDRLVRAVATLGLFWAVINETPSAPVSRPSASARGETP